MTKNKIEEVVLFINRKDQFGLVTKFGIIFKNKRLNNFLKMTFAHKENYKKKKNMDASYKLINKLHIYGFNSSRYDLPIISSAMISHIYNEYNVKSMRKSFVSLIAMG